VNRYTIVTYATICTVGHTIGFVKSLQYYYFNQNEKVPKQVQHQGVLLKHFLVPDSWLAGSQIADQSIPFMHYQFANVVS
jgi:hypothetical protein